MVWAVLTALGVAAFLGGLAAGLWRAGHTARLRRELDLTEARDAQAAFMGTIGSGLAHELKTPLSTIDINVQLLEEAWRDPQTDRERQTYRKIEALQRSLRKIEEIIKSFVRFAKDPQPRRTPVSIQKLLQEVLEGELPDALTAMGRVDEIRVSYDLDEKLPRVSIDVPLVRQVILNLLLNAVEAIEGEGRITIGCSRRANQIRISVQDTGRGVPAEIRPRIWELYFTTKPSGIGMGLPIARRIVEAHGGRIEVEGNGGTTFNVFLPIEDD